MNMIMIPVSLCHQIYYLNEKDWTIKAGSARSDIQRYKRKPF